jgi:5-methylcytosine-specific restriction protein B
VLQTAVLRESPTAPYTLDQCANDTGLPPPDLSRWLRAIERKGQAILYGPPGTGKTFLAQKLAQHLTQGNNGFWEMVQFHPAYAYEDFVQGIRPFTDDDGTLHYDLVNGRFLQFCQRASQQSGPCVLIIDEINRANLAAVFGELMLLLEYRDASIPLAAGGSFHIPANVRLIGTMNTADRSIALVDHALRRRFAFIHLPPNYDVLRHYHQNTDFNPEPLIKLLQKLNRQIDDPHYLVGITYFLHPNLTPQLADIWKLEIEPYLEEYFFDQPDQVETFRWEKVSKQLTL